MYTLNIYNHIYQVFLNKAPTKENLFREDRVQCKYNQNNSSSKCLNMQVTRKVVIPGHHLRSKVQVFLYILKFESRP